MTFTSHLYKAASVLSCWYCYILNSFSHVQFLMGVTFFLHFMSTNCILRDSTDSIRFMNMVYPYYVMHVTKSLHVLKVCLEVGMHASESVNIWVYYWLVSAGWNQLLSWLSPSQFWHPFMLQPSKGVRETFQFSEYLNPVSFIVMLLQFYEWTVEPHCDLLILNTLQGAIL